MSALGLSHERIFLDYGGQIIERRDAPDTNLGYPVQLREQSRPKLSAGPEVVSASEHGGAAYLTRTALP
jgi:hypothetical protein